MPRQRRLQPWQHTSMRAAGRRSKRLWIATSSNTHMHDLMLWCVRALAARGVFAAPAVLHLASKLGSSCYAAVPADVFALVFLLCTGRVVVVSHPLLQHLASVGSACTCVMQEALQGNIKVGTALVRLGRKSLSCPLRVLLASWHGMHGATVQGTRHVRVMGAARLAIRSINKIVLLRVQLSSRLVNWVSRVGTAHCAKVASSYEYCNTGACLQLRFACLTVQVYNIGLC